MNQRFKLFANLIFPTTPWLILTFIKNRFQVCALCGHKIDTRITMQKLIGIQWFEIIHRNFYNTLDVMITCTQHG